MFKTFTVMELSNSKNMWKDVTVNINHIIKITYGEYTTIHMNNEYYVVHGKPNASSMLEMLNS